jgi:hypothetical protein
MGALIGGQFKSWLGMYGTFIARWLPAMWTKSLLALSGHP